MHSRSSMTIDPRVPTYNAGPEKVGVFTDLAGITRTKRERSAVRLFGEKCMHVERAASCSRTACEADSFLYMDDSALGVVLEPEPFRQTGLPKT